MVTNHFIFAGCLLGMFLFHPTSDISGQTNQRARSSQTIAGQLQLPPGNGTRGIQVVIKVGEGDSAHHEWLVLDREFRFNKSIDGVVSELEVVAGIDKTILKLDSQKLNAATKVNNVNVGTIDLREHLQSFQFKLVSESVAPVRVGMWFAKPPADVSLGSRQFPEINPDAELVWLLPRKFELIYFLVEQPADERRGRNWRTGSQKLFGPFKASELPTELSVK